MHSLSKKQREEIKSEMVTFDKAIPVRFLVNGQALDINNGSLLSKGINVIYHPVYWNFTKETAKKIAKYTGSKAVWDYNNSEKDQAKIISGME